ncbi:MAG TPA: AglZ/HisF2 family acetamidino modification protein [Vicinamibacterales bacterium]|nr:AglZ/HisF2 family acetamidino modification protein [Vicinamibacterales bacterium]
MLRPRITPCLLVRNGGLVKTVGFKDEKYVGDPLNAVKIFNEKEADELVVVDIDASVAGSAPNVRLIAQIAVECRMPLCYGGGIKTLEQARSIIALGVEKIAIGSAAVETPPLISAIAEAIGRQSVVVVFDVRRAKGADYEVWTHNGRRNTGRRLIDAITEAESRGAGEILVNSIDQDGRMSGYDLTLARQAREATHLPMTVLGGAGSVADIGELIKACGVVGAAAGSLFVFKGPHRAVLISYPNATQRDDLIRSALSREGAAGN